MTSKLMLDTNVLARICHPTQYQEVQEWLRALLARGADAPELLVSVLADYELRRMLLDVDASASLERLEAIARSLRYVPLSAEAGRRAAELRHALGKEATRGLADSDLLMAAQAQLEGAVLVTSDRAMLQIPGLVAKDWSEVVPGDR